MPEHTGKKRPIALTIAGSDPSGGAGIQADLKTFTALRVYGASVVTALTAQNTLGVTGVHTVPPDFMTAQLDAVATDLDIDAVKTGMLGDRATVTAVCEGIRRHKLAPLVVDPVMVATSGDVLLAPDAIEAVRGELLPLASIVTPNLAEAAKLLQSSVATSEGEMQRQAEALLAFGPRAVLIKGGHGKGPEAVDLLLSADGSMIRLARPRIDTPHTHGTGCTLAAAIAAYLARGLSLEKSAELGKDYLWRALESGRTLGIGRGSGPVDHMHAIAD